MSHPIRCLKKIAQPYFRVADTPSESTAGFLFSELSCFLSFLPDDSLPFVLTYTQEAVRSLDEAQCGMNKNAQTWLECRTTSLGEYSVFGQTLTLYQPSTKEECFSLSCLDASNSLFSSPLLFSQTLRITELQNHLGKLGTPTKSLGMESLRVLRDAAQWCAFPVQELEDDISFYCLASNDKEFLATCANTMKGIEFYLNSII